MCPVTQQEMNGYRKFVLLWSCGCLLSQRALDELGGVKEMRGKCVNCGVCYNPTDIVSMNQSKEEQEKARNAIIEAEKEKKDRKKKDAKKKSVKESEYI